MKTARFFVALAYAFALQFTHDAFAADTKISALPAGTTLGGTEPIPAVQTGSTVRTTPSALSTYTVGQINASTITGKFSGSCDSTKLLRGDGACSNSLTSSELRLVDGRYYMYDSTQPVDKRLWGFELDSGQHFLLQSYADDGTAIGQFFSLERDGGLTFCDAGGVTCAAFSTNDLNFTAQDQVNINAEIRLLSNVTNAQELSSYIITQTTGGSLQLGLAKSTHSAALATGGPSTGGLLNVGTSLPLTFATNGVARAVIDSSRNVVAGIGANGTADTDGFLYVPKVAGTPTGVPANLTGIYANTSPIRYDTTNNKWCAYNSAWQCVGVVFSGTTASIGGGALIAGACTSGTVSITGAATTMVADVNPNTYPGDGATWSAQVTSANTVTVRVCAVIAVTPTASTYKVRVFQ